MDNGLNETATVGPVNNKRQKDFVSELVEDAKNSGARVTPLGQIIDRESFEKGYFLQPTFITDMKTT